MDTYGSAASAGFALLIQQYKKPNIFAGSFWWGGNALNVCLDYLDAAGVKDTGDDAPNILSYAFNSVYTELTKPGHDWWKDDYTWWGNAFVKALNCREQLGYAAPSYDQLFKDILAATQNCWQLVLANWRDKNYTSVTDNSAASAPIGGGTFNHAPDPPSLPPMSGRNCVTNEGFWILSQGLAQLIPNDTKYATLAEKEEAWFGQWLALPEKDPSSVGLLNPVGLVLERPTGNKTDPSWYWSGDQGLYITARNSNDAGYKVADSATKNMSVGGILHENMGFMDYDDLTQFIADYATGKGILMWSLASFNGIPFDDFINKNAASVWCNRQAKNQFTFNWDPEKPFPGAEPTTLRVSGKTNDFCDLVMQAAGQGALNAAVRIGLADTEITC